MLDRMWLEIRTASEILRRQNCNSTSQQNAVLTFPNWKAKKILVSFLFHCLKIWMIIAWLLNRIVLKNSKYLPDACMHSSRPTLRKWLMKTTCVFLMKDSNVLRIFYDIDNQTNKVWLIDVDFISIKHSNFICIFWCNSKCFTNWLTSW